MDLVFNAIADGLAEEGYAVVDQFLSQEEVNAILELDEFRNGLTQFKKAGIGKSQQHQINESIRGDYIQWLDKNTAPASVKIYLDRLNDLILFLNQSLYLSLKDSEVHMTIYPAGSFYKRHLDQFKKDDHRKLSVICYLNHDWKEEHGGQLRIYLKDETKDFLPVAGRLICFRSDQLEHEVLLANRERLSLTGWMLDQHTDIR
ncbi:MAG TPA: 2OG-Fe(II) oxygenase [Chryseolinea sp.]|nr:2OG-Fe(II) oxygenase [Chryseolinea sp.]HPM28921.1 2OG-Fe(II) oxygenase [Chryseolinea sp.]